MKKHNIALAIFASVALGSTAVNAATTTVTGGTINFTGDIVAAACSVSTNSDGQTVALGQYRTASFTAAGDTTTSVPFTIVLNDCDTTVATTAKVAFMGQADATDATLLAVNASGDNATVATGVGIQILDSKSAVLSPDGATYSTAQTLLDGTNTLNFSARYKSTAAAVTAGKANSDATFYVQYN